MWGIYVQKFKGKSISSCTNGAVPICLFSPFSLCSLRMLDGFLGRLIGDAAPCAIFLYGCRTCLFQGISVPCQRSQWLLCRFWVCAHFQNCLYLNATTQRKTVKECFCVCSLALLKSINFVIDFKSISRYQLPDLPMDDDHVIYFSLQILLCDKVLRKYQMLFFFPCYSVGTRYKTPVRVCQIVMHSQFSWTFTGTAGI